MEDNLTCNHHGNMSNLTQTIAESGFNLQRLRGKHIGLGILSIFCVVGNSCLIFTIIHHKHLRTVTNMFIVSLGVADLLFGLITAPLHIMAESLEYIIGEWRSNICLVAMSLTSFQVIISMTMLLAITIERYICILHPLKHRKWSQPYYVGMLIGLLWLYASVYGVLPLMGWNILNYNHQGDNCTNHRRCTPMGIYTVEFLGLIFYGNIVPICVTVPFLYVRMFRAVRQFLIRKASNGLIYNTNPEQQIGYHGHRGSHSNHCDQEVMRRVSRRSLRLLVVILIYFLFSWMPSFVWYVVATRGFTVTHMTPQHIKRIPIPIIFAEIAGNLGFANSALNPFIYGLGNVRIRKAFFRLFRNCSLKRKPKMSRSMTGLRSVTSM